MMWALHAQSAHCDLLLLDGSNDTDPVLDTDVFEIMLNVCVFVFNLCAMIDLRNPNETKVFPDFWHVYETCLSVNMFVVSSLTPDSYTSPKHSAIR